MNAKIRDVPGSLWPLVEAGTFRAWYLDQDGDYQTITVGEDGRLIRRTKCKPYNQDLVGPGVFKEWFLDRSGQNLVVAVGEDHRVLERVRLFRPEEEKRVSNYLRHRYELHDPLTPARRCRECRAWFFPKPRNRVRCRSCIDAGRTDGRA